MTALSLPRELCYQCQAELSDVEIEVAVLGSAPLCDTCRDVHFYETPVGQLELLQAKHELETEKLKEQLAVLEDAVLAADTRATAQSEDDLARIKELEAEVTRLRDESTRWPGPRSRPSPLA